MKVCGIWKKEIKRGENMKIEESNEEKKDRDWMLW